METEPPRRTALVQWWDHQEMHVLCPWCDEIHRHSFNGYYEQQRRLAHCRIGRYGITEYDAEFPLGSSSAEVCCEIDKQNFRFVRGGGRLPDPGIPKGQADRLRATFRQHVLLKRRWSESLDVALSDMVQGHVQNVRRFLETSPKANLFLHGVESTEVTWPGESEEEEDDEGHVGSDALNTNGVTALHMAADEGSPEMVKLLLSKGANPNALDIDGRTPLMRAALWGRLENVVALLQYGAEKSLESIEGNTLWRAADYAKPLQENERRRGRAIYKEDIVVRNWDRKEIMFLLGQDTQQPTISRLEGFTFRQTPDISTSVSLITHYSLPRSRKTIARLIRGGRLPEIAAMSGWSHSESETVQVAGVDWTQSVLDLCHHIKFRLETHNLDGAIPGRFNACHAEKQLIAFFIHKHLILPHETEETEGHPDEISLSRLTLEDLSSTEAYERLQRERASRDQREYAKKLQALEKVWPRLFPKGPLILVSREVCHDCQGFVKRVNEVLGLRIKVLHSMSTN